MMMMMKFILAVSGFVLSVLSHVISCEERKPVCVETLQRCRSPTDQLTNTSPLQPINRPVFLPVFSVACNELKLLPLCRAKQRLFW